MNSPDTERPAPAEAGAADAALPAASRALRTGVILELLGATTLGVVGLRGGLGRAENSRPSQIVDTLQGGPQARHAGFRRARARGLCVSGRRIPSGDPGTVRGRAVRRC